MHLLKLKDKIQKYKQQSKLLKGLHFPIIILLMKLLRPLKRNQSVTLLIFHLGTAGRLLQKVFLPVFALFFFFYFFLGSVFFAELTASFIRGGYFTATLPTSIFALFVAQIAGKRITYGVTGWMQHLPVTRSKARRTVMVALLISLLPLLALPACLTLVAGSKNNLNTAAFLIGLSMVGMVASLFALPVKNRYLSRPILLLATLLLSSQQGYLIVTGFILFVIADLVSGPLVTIERRTGFSSPKLIHLLLIWRALRLRILIPYLCSFLSYIVLFLSINNNPYHFRQTQMAIHMSVGLCFIIFCAGFSQLVALRRPAWLWKRSLPTSAQTRIGNDGTILALHLFPLILFSLIIQWQIMIYLVFGLPSLILYSVLASRRISDNRLGISGQIFSHSIIPLFLFVLLPWSSILFLVITPWVYKRAILEDKSLAVSSWQERTHVPESDSQYWRET